MTAPVFGVLPTDAAVDLGLVPGGAPCSLAHFDREKRPIEKRPAHRWAHNGTVSVLCDGCARSRWPEAFER